MEITGLAPNTVHRTRTAVQRFSEQTFTRTKLFNRTPFTEQNAEPNTGLKRRSEQNAEHQAACSKWPNKTPNKTRSAEQNAEQIAEQFTPGLTERQTKHTLPNRTPNKSYKTRTAQQKWNNVSIENSESTHSKQNTKQNTPSRTKHRTK